MPEYNLEILRQVALVVLPIVGAILLAPNSVLKNLAKVPGFSPNCITVWRGVMPYIGIYLICSGDWVVGVALVAAGQCLDKTDGDMARALGFECRIFEKRRNTENFFLEFLFRGMTSVGEWLDPLVDKLVILPNLALMICQIQCGSLERMLAVILFVVMLPAEVLGTIIRPPFTRPVKTVRWLRSCKATWPGKIKTVFSMLALSVLLLGKIRAISADDAAGIAVGILIAAVIMAWVSLVTKVRLTHFFGDLPYLGRIASAIDQAVEAVFR